MTDTRFDVYFSGQLIGGVTAEQAAGRLAELFKTQPERLGHLFSGAPVAVKRNVSRAEAIRYRQALSQAGMTSIFREHGAAAPASPAAPGARGGSPADAPAPTAPSSTAASSTAASSTAAAEPGSLSLAPVGADVLRPEERPRVEPVNPDLSGLSLAPAGTELLRPEEKAAAISVDIDTSALKLA